MVSKQINTQMNTQGMRGYKNTYSSVGPSQGVGDYSMLKARPSVKKVVDTFDYKRFTGEKYGHRILLRLYLEKTQASAKRPLDGFVTSIDDLGPEIILNLRLIDTYRYPSSAAYLYYDLLQSILFRHCW